MGPQNQLNRQSTKETECKSLYNDTERRRSSESVARQTAQSRTNSGIKIMICSPLFLHSKEGWITVIGSRL